MKHLIVGADFSKDSEHALEFAINMANATKSEITLVYVDSSNIEIATNEYQTLRKDILLSFDELLQTYEPRMHNKTITTKIRKGKVNEELNALADSLEESVIVVGTHGLSGFEEYWIGTNAFRVVSTAKHPVVTVRMQNETRSDIKRIALPVDHTVSTMHKIQAAAKLAKQLEADFNVIGINSSELKSVQKVVDANIAKTIKILEEHNVNYIVDKINKEPLGNLLVEHLNKLECDLLIITVELQQKAYNGLLTPLMQHLINYAPVPVMNVHPNYK